MSIIYISIILSIHLYIYIWNDFIEVTTQIQTSAMPLSVGRNGDTNQNMEKLI